MWQMWLIISGIFFVVEMITVGFLVFWLGVGALFAMVVSLFTDNLIIQTSTFVISSTLLLFLTKPLVKRVSHSDKVKTNAYSIIGKKGIVTIEINSKKGIGQVKVGSEIWTAKSSTDDIIAEGTEIEIVEISGVKAIVTPILVNAIK